MPRMPNRTFAPTARGTKRPPERPRLYEQRGFRPVLAAERPPRAGEWYVGAAGQPQRATFDWEVGARVILERADGGQA